MPNLPQAEITVSAQPFIRPSDSPYQASVGLSGLLRTLVQTSQRRRLRGLDIASQMEQSLVTVSTENPRHYDFTSLTDVETNNPDGEIENFFPERDYPHDAVVSTNNPTGYVFDQGEFTAFICVETANPKVEKSSTFQSEVTVEANEITGGVFYGAILPSVEVTVETNLLDRSKSNKLTQSLVEVITANPLPPIKYDDIPNATVRVQTNLFDGVRYYNLWDDDLTFANSGYALVGRASGITFSEFSSFYNYNGNVTLNFSATQSVSLNRIAIFLSNYFNSELANTIRIYSSSNFSSNIFNNLRIVIHDGSNIRVSGSFMDYNSNTVTFSIGNLNLADFNDKVNIAFVDTSKSNLDTINWQIRLP